MALFPNKLWGKWNVQGEALKRKLLQKFVFPLSLLSLLPQPFVAKG